MSTFDLHPTLRWASTKVRIDQNSPNFIEQAQHLHNELSLKETTIEEFAKLSNSAGLILKDNKTHILMKNEAFGNKLYEFDSFNLDIKSLLKSGLGEDFYRIIFDRLRKAEVIVESENYDEEISKWQNLEVTFQNDKTS